MNQEIETCAAIIMIPANAVKLEITAKIIDENDELYEALTTMSLPEIVDARIDGEDWERENVKYVLTDKAKEFLVGGKKL